jgi:hypothetical protein
VRELHGPQHPHDSALAIDARFAGPPDSANGGYVAGRLASMLPAGAVVEVTLRQPSPLETSLDLAVSGDRATLRFGGVIIADAVVSALTEDAVAPVHFDVAAQAMSSYAGFDQHPFPAASRAAPTGGRPTAWACARDGSPRAARMRRHDVGPRRLNGVRDVRRRVARGDVGGAGLPGRQVAPPRDHEGSDRF